VAALACAQKGFSVSLFEAQPAIDDSPRAATTHPATLEMLDRLGLIDEYIAQGLVARYVQFWDRPTRSRIVEFDHAVLRDETKFPFVVQTEQHKLVKMGIARLRHYADASVQFETLVTAVSQDPNGVTATLEGPNGRSEAQAGT
jgi:3-(3-hydroxy-phenyl)propionate hydroxylase